MGTNVTRPNSLAVVQPTPPANSEHDSPLSFTDGLKLFVSATGVGCSNTPGEDDDNSASPIPSTQSAWWDFTYAEGAFNCGTDACADYYIPSAIPFSANDAGQSPFETITLAHECAPTEPTNIITDFTIPKDQTLFSVDTTYYGSASLTTAEEGHGTSQCQKTSGSPSVTYYKISTLSLPLELDLFSGLCTGLYTFTGTGITSKTDDGNLVFNISGTASPGGTFECLGIDASSEAYQGIYDVYMSTHVTVDSSTMIPTNPPTPTPTPAP